MTILHLLWYASSELFIAPPGIWSLDRSVHLFQVDLCEESIDRDGVTGMRIKQKKCDGKPKLYGGKSYC